MAGQAASEKPPRSSHAHRVREKDDLSLKERERRPIRMHLNFPNKQTKSKSLDRTHRKFSAHNFSIFNPHSAVTAAVHKRLYVVCSNALLFNVTNCSHHVRSWLRLLASLALPLLFFSFPLPCDTQTHTHTWRRVWSETGRRPTGADGQKKQVDETLARSLTRDRIIPASSDATRCSYSRLPLKSALYLQVSLNWNQKNWRC